MYIVATGSGYGSKPRPAVIVQSDLFAVTESVTVCLMTAREIEAGYVRVAIAPTSSNGLDRPSWIMVDKVLAIHRRKVGRHVGALGTDDLRELDRAMLLFFGLADPANV